MPQNRYDILIPVCEDPAYTNAAEFAKKNGLA
jgi:hypothetical protein